MTLLFAVSAMALAVLYGSWVFVGARQTRPSKIMSEFWVSSIHVPLMITLGILGVGLLIRWMITLPESDMSLIEVVMGIGILLAAAILRKLMGIQERLAALESRRPSENMIPLSDLKESGPPARPTTPRKAA